jgi:hypothetical protein
LEIARLLTAYHRRQAHQQEQQAVAIANAVCLMLGGKKKGQKRDVSPDLLLARMSKGV